MIYAGIGSRETPFDICYLMTQIGFVLAKEGWALRSGHAKGSDRAFEDGCVLAGGHKEIFTAKDDITDAAYDLAAKFHPAWWACDKFARKLHARNGYIILGKDLQTPVDTVICYSPGGYEKGGTSQGLRIAREYNIPVVNMFDEKVYRELFDIYKVKMEKYNEGRGN